MDSNFQVFLTACQYSVTKADDAAAKVVLDAIKAGAAEALVGVASDTSGSSVAKVDKIKLTAVTKTSTASTPTGALSSVFSVGTAIAILAMVF